MGLSTLTKMTGEIGNFKSAMAEMFQDDEIAPRIRVGQIAGHDQLSDDSKWFYLAG